MTQQQAGWYADPEGNASKLRFWDGNQWTQDYMDAPSQAAIQPAAQATAQGASPDQTVVQTADTAQVAAQPTGAAQAASQQQTYAPQAGQNVSYSASATNQFSQPQVAQTYPMTENDQTLRLVAFVLNVICTVLCCWLIIPLAWMIPMTVHSWGIYKGTKPNTVAFGVCTLFFLSLVSGILLLVSTKNE